ncbi:hypothetical protein LguiA_029561 [Lonicera macranthoides]
MTLLTHSIGCPNLVTEKQIELDAVTYGTVINGLCKSGNTNIAMELLMMVDALCKEGMVREAEDVLDIMIQRGEVPDIVKYSALMGGYCLRGQIEEARKKRRIDEALHLFKDVSCKRLNYNIVTYNTILHGLFKNEKFDVAREVFNEMLAKGRSPDVVTYNIVLDCMCKNRQFAKAFSFFHSMQNSELYTDIACFNLLIDAACKDGKLEIAKELLSELLSNGLLPNACTYNAIINGLCQESLYEVKELLMRMEDNDCLPSSQ